MNEGVFSSWNGPQALKISSGLFQSHCFGNQCHNICLPPHFLNLIHISYFITIPTPAVSLL